jgi:DNA-binding MarR family transcriptional regulator
MTCPGRDGCPEPTGLPAELAGLDEASAAVFRAFMKTLRLHRQFMVRHFADVGIHPGQAICLHIVAANDGIAQRDLAAEMHIAAPTLSRMLRTMEKGGLVERRPDAADQRLVRVQLSPAGQALEHQTRGATVEFVSEAVTTLPHDDRVELARLLDDLSSSLSRALAGADEHDGAAR